MKRRSGADLLKLLNNVSVLINKDGISFEGSDGKLEEDNRVLKRLVNFPSLEEWERKAILCEDLKIVRACAMEFCKAKEDLRTSRTGPSRVVDLLSVRAHVWVNFLKLDKVLWYVSGKNGCSSLKLNIHSPKIHQRNNMNKPYTYYFATNQS